MRCFDSKGNCSCGDDSFTSKNKIYDEEETLLNEIKNKVKKATQISTLKVWFYSATAVAIALNVTNLYYLYQTLSNAT